MPVILVPEVGRRNPDRPLLPANLRKNYDH